MAILSDLNNVKNVLLDLEKQVLMPFLACVLFCLFLEAPLSFCASQGLATLVASNPGHKVPALLALHCTLGASGGSERNATQFF